MIVPVFHPTRHRVTFASPGTNVKASRYKSRSGTGIIRFHIPAGLSSRGTNRPDSHPARHRPSKTRFRTSVPTTIRIGHRSSPPPPTHAIEASRLIGHHPYLGARVPTTIQSGIVQHPRSRPSTESRRPDNRLIEHHPLPWCSCPVQNRESSNTWGTFEAERSRGPDNNPESGIVLLSLPSPGGCPRKSSHHSHGHDHPQIEASSLTMTPWCPDNHPGRAPVIFAFIERTKPDRSWHLAVAPPCPGNPFDRASFITCREIDEGTQIRTRVRFGSCPDNYPIGHRFFVTSH